MLENLSIDLYLDEDDLPPMPLLESDEEVKLEPEETITERIKLNPQKNNNKLLTKLPKLLAQIKAENNSYKLKNEIRQILNLLYQIIKSLKKFTTV